MNDNKPPPPLLRIPNHMRTVDEVLGVAKQLDLPNILVLSELEDGRLVFLDSDLNLAEANWLLDRMKYLLASGATTSKEDA